MEVLYKSTRNGEIGVKASEAILKGLSEDGGLFVPDHIPALDKSLQELAGMNYREVADEVMKLYLTDFTEEELRDCISRASSPGRRLSPTTPTTCWRRSRAFSRENTRRICWWKAI